MKTDVHLHLTLEGMEKNEGMEVSSANVMMSHLRELGIGKGIVMSMGENPGLPMNNEECRKIHEKYPHTYEWMCNVSPEIKGDLLRRLTALKRQGAVGIGEFIVNKRLDDPFIEAVFEAASTVGLPLLFHMSLEAGRGYGVADDQGLPYLRRALKMYPRLIFIGHSQPFWHEISGDAMQDYESRNSWGKGPVFPGGKTVELFEAFDNLWGDLSANSGGCAVMRDEMFGLDFLERFQDRLLFGTDMTNTKTVFPLGKWLDEKREQGRLSETAYEKICRENAKRLFHL